MPSAALLGNICPQPESIGFVYCAFQRFGVISHIVSALSISLFIPHALKRKCISSPLPIAKEESEADSTFQGKEDIHKQPKEGVTNRNAPVAP